MIGPHMSAVAFAVSAASTDRYEGEGDIAWELFPDYHLTACMHVGFPAFRLLTQQEVGMHITTVLSSTQRDD